MDDKTFWSRAANRGFILGLALAVMHTLSWAFRWETTAVWAVNLYYLILIVVAIVVSGRKNMAIDPKYTYGRSIGFIFAMMMFAGVVSGIGMFLLHAYVAPEYYSELLQSTFDKVLLQSGANDMLIDTLDKAAPMADKMFRNPFYCIFSEVFTLAIKGGFLGFILAIFLSRRTDSTPFRTND